MTCQLRQLHQLRQLRHIAQHSRGCLNKQTNKPKSYSIASPPNEPGRQFIEIFLINHQEENLL